MEDDLVDELNKEIEKLKNALIRIAFKANMRRNVKDPLPMKTWLSQNNLSDAEIWSLVESLGDIAATALKGEK
jgi:hypothetical protein